MPFKSESQRRKFYQLKAKGLISEQELNQWEKETGNKKLPQRVSKKRKSNVGK